MTLVALEGAGVWMPTMPAYLSGSAVLGHTDGITLDANGEEAQFIGTVTIDGGGSKTFGTSSKLGWMPGAATVFATGSTLRLGVKQAADVNMSSGPPARATVGTAAFAVWDDLVGGTDTIPSVTWREDTMTAGTPFTVTDGDLLAICFSLTVSSGTPSVKVSGTSSGGGMTNSVTATLVTTGPAYAATLMLPNLLLSFDDGTLGWFEPAKLVSSSGDLTTGTIGNGNSLANIVQVPFPCQINAVAAVVATGSGGGDVALEVVGTPLGTPTILDTVPIDANVMNVSTVRLIQKRLPASRTLTANTAYAISLKQTTGLAVTGVYFDVANGAYFKPMGMGANCYAANSTGGATFVAQNSGLRRYHIWMRLSAVDDGTGGASAGGGGSVFGAAGGVIS